MNELFQFPDVQVERDQMVMFRTPFPKQDDERVHPLVRRFDVRGDLQDLGSRSAVRSRQHLLEVFHASDSLRLTHLGRSAEAERPPKLIGEDQAIELALAYLHEKGLADDRASVKSVTYTELSRIGQEQKEPETFPIAVHVNFGFTLDGLPVFGPGAKMQVTIEDESTVTEFYKFWRAPVEDRTLEILRPEAAIERFSHDQNYAELDAGSAKVVVHRIQLGYYALPPREVQGYLVPVYAFNGTVSTEAFERYDFTRYVVAVDLNNEEVKQARAVFRAPVAIF